MGLYNMLFKVDQNAGNYLQVLGLDYKKIDRFRDLELVKVGEEYRLRLLTRTGGNNRQDSEESIKALQAHPLYIEDRDVEYDSTYAEFDFKLPDGMLEEIKKQGIDIENIVAKMSFEEKFKAAITELEKVTPGSESKEQ